MIGPRLVSRMEVALELPRVDAMPVECPLLAQLQGGVERHAPSAVVELLCAGHLAAPEPRIHRFAAEAGQVGDLAW